MPGQLWVIEGSDGTGKATQAQLLVNRINQEKGDFFAAFYSFPIYSSSWGKLIRQYLNGDFGDPKLLNPYLTSLLYTADRREAAQAMKKSLIDGGWIICDRYVPSNMAHQGAKITNMHERKKFYDWLEETEYELFGIPRPTGIILLHLPVGIARKRMEAQRRKKDGHEESLNYLGRVTEEYYRLANWRKWHIVECVEGERELTPDEVGEKIWEIIGSSLK